MQRPVSSVAHKNKDTKGRMLVLRSYLKRKNEEKQTNQTTQPL